MKKKEEQHREPIRIEQIDQAESDLRFVQAFLNILFQVNEIGVIQDSISRMCWEAIQKADSLKDFLNYVPFESSRKQPGY